VNNKYPTLPFTTAGFADQVGAKLGVKECINHDLLIQYPVLIERPAEYVAHFKTTVAVLPRSTQVIAGNLPFDVTRFESTNSVKNEELKTLLASDLWKKEDKKKK